MLKYLIQSLAKTDKRDPLDNVSTAVPYCPIDIAQVVHMCRWHGIKLLVAASALEFRHQGSETFVCPAGTEAHTEATLPGGFDTLSQYGGQAIHIEMGGRDMK